MIFQSSNDFPSSRQGSTGWPWTQASMELPPYMPNGSDWPRISVVTPSYNQGRFLEETIRSVILQNYPNLEYIVMDGGSTDTSLEIIKKYEPWLTCWVSEKDEGQYEAINKGFAGTSGNIMLWLNSDDMLMPGSLWVIATVFSEFPQIKWVTGIPVLWNEQGSFFQILPQLSYSRKLMQLAGYEGRAIHWVMQECTAWTRELWNQAGACLATDLPLAGDFDLWHRFSFHAQLYTIAALLGGNRQHAGQKTARQSKYYQDIDRLLKTQPLYRLANRIMRFSIVSKCIRSALLIRRMKNHIYFNAKANKWVKQ